MSRPFGGGSSWLLAYLSGEYLVASAGGRGGLVRDIDAEVVEAGGIVGKHAGDSVTALFLADDAAGESAP
jgi:hypothetical protein